MSKQHNKVLISSIQCIPTELLARIFTSLPPALFPEGAKDRFVLMSVCRKWRDIILDTPEMWTEIGWPATGPDWFAGNATSREYVSDETRRTRIARIPPLGALQSWTRRAKAAGLNVTMNIGKALGPTPLEEQEYNPWSGIQTPEDWRRCVLNNVAQALDAQEAASSAILRDPAALLGLGTMHVLSLSPHFRSLNVSLTYAGDNISAWEHLIRSLGMASNLQVLSLTSSGFRQMEHGKLVCALQKCPRVQEVVLRSLLSLRVWNDGIALFHELIAAPSLLSLEIEDSKFSSSAGVFESLVILSKRFPKLEKLKITHPARPSRRTSTNPTCLLELPSLQVLSLERCKLPVQLLSKVVGSATLLKELSITMQYWSSSTEAKKSLLPLLPNLETLHISITHESSGRHSHLQSPINNFAYLPSLKRLALSFSFGPWNGRLLGYLNFIREFISFDGDPIQGGNSCPELEHVDWRFPIQPPVAGLGWDGQSPKVRGRNIRITAFQ
jgi:hypothetical protein